MISSESALGLLKEGNERFVLGRTNLSDLVRPERRRELVHGQSPFAVVLGCSDSRVPSEIVFDHGLGDLFCIRVAGNVVAPTQIGSVEFAVERLGTRLVLVLGHSGCGAVAAALEGLRNPTEEPSSSLTPILDRIRLAAEPLLAGSSGDPESILKEAVRANIRASVSHLRGASRLRDLIASDGLAVLGAEYHLETGRVEFLD